MVTFFAFEIIMIIKDMTGLRILTTSISRAMANYICYDQDKILSKHCCIKIFLNTTKYTTMAT